jgi:negative regulator of sigma E activity
MNESDLENKLRSITPARPSRSLENRIARDLAPQPIHASSGMIARAKPAWLARFLVPLGWAGAGAIAAVVIMQSLDQHSAGNPDASPITPQVAAAAGAGDVQHEVLDVADEGILDDATSGPSRVLRYTSLERRQWSDASGAITLVEIPREEVVLVPVTFQ